MADTKPIPVRLDTQIIARLDAAAKRLGNNRAGIIKLCVSTFLDHLEAHGGRMALPPDWEEILSRLDGRTRDARAHRAASETPRKTSATARGVSSTVAGVAAAGARGALAKALREAQASSPRPPVAAPSAGKAAPKRAAGGRPKSLQSTPTPAPTESST